MYMNKAVAQLQAAGRPIAEELLVGLSPLIHEHINFSGRYFFPRPEVNELRPLRDPDAEDDEL
jgi:Tn3 transposase DDE domain